MHEVAAWAVGTVASGVEGSAQLRLVFGMSGQSAKFVRPVSELALVTVFAGTTVLVGPTELRLVPATIDHRSIGPLLGGVLSVDLYRVACSLEDWRMLLLRASSAG